MPPSGRMTSERLEEIEQVAEAARRLAAERLAEFGLSWEGDTDLCFVATLLTGGPVEATPNLTRGGERLAGCLEATGPMPRLEYEAYDPPVRQRFSIAHELGHFFLHRESGDGLHRRCSERYVDPAGRPGAEPEEGLEPEEALERDETEHDSGMPEAGDAEAEAGLPNGSAPDGQGPVVRPLAEVEADTFAAAFLLPVETLQADLKHFGPCVPFLAERHQVAEATLRRRLHTVERMQRSTPHPPPTEGSPKVEREEAR